MKVVNPDWKANWKREIEGAMLYHKLAMATRSVDLKNALETMAEQEKQHAAIWENHVREVDANIRPPKPDLRIYLVGWLGRWLGPTAVLGFLLADEVSDIASYVDQSRQAGDDTTYQQVIRDETTHARTLVALKDPEAFSHAEPWHRGASAGGWLRNLVYGFNDGLTANFGLVMGVVGANVDRNFILITGFAGLVADALSMAASGFLAARSEQEVRQYHLALEAAEVKLMPEEERAELARFYTRKGLTPEEASVVASRLMQKPDVALTQLAREELRIDPESPANPLQEGLTTGVATTLGAIIPLLPFFFLSGSAAVWSGVGISMVAHFLVGASRAVFTGRPAIRSGFEMFLVGMGVALVTYLLGLLIAGKL